MKRARCLLIFRGLIILSIISCFSSLRAAPDPVDPDVLFLQQNGINQSDAGLMEFLRFSSISEANPQQLERLIRQLGSDDLQRREQASRHLLAIRERALPALRKVRYDSNEEIAQRAKTCVQRIDRDSIGGLPLVTVRLLLRRQPAGTAEALLRFLPYAVGEELVEDIWYGIYELAKKDSKVRPHLLLALEDPHPARRALAGLVLGRLGNEEERTAAKRLLTDADAAVRLRTAQGLLASKDKSVIPVLIGLLGEAASELAWQGEELLHWVAGDQSPEVVVGKGTLKGRLKSQSAWQAWWDKHGARLDLKPLDKDHRRPGLLLLPKRHVDVLGDSVSRVVLCGCDGKLRWESSSFKDPADAHLLLGTRLLIAESEEKRVVECDLFGKVLWEKQLDKRGCPVACQRLANGNTFIATQLGVLEVAPDGKEVFFIAYDPGFRNAFGGAQKLPNGNFITISEKGLIIEKDCSTRRCVKQVQVLENFHLGEWRDWRVEFLPSGMFLATSSHMAKVLEVDATGKTLWKYDLNNVGRTRRLRNGNTLIVSYTRGLNLHEVDRTGRKVWEMPSAENCSLFRPCLGLVRLGFDMPYAPDLDLDSVAYQLRLLKNKDADVRLGAVRAFQIYGERAEPAIPALVEALEDPDERVCKSAGVALEKVGPAAIPALIKALKHKRADVRTIAACSLAAFPRTEPKMVRALLEALRDEDPEVRVNAARSLSGKGVETRARVVALGDALKDVDIEVCRMAAGSLARIGPEAEAAIPALLDALKSKDGLLRSRSAYALGEIRKPNQPVITALSTILNERASNQDVLAAVSALGMIGPEAKAAIPELLKLLKVREGHDPEVATRLGTRIAWALGQMRGEARTAVPALSGLVQDRTMHRDVRIAAADALGQIGATAKTALPVLTVARQDEDELVRKAAAKALARITGGQ